LPALAGLSPDYPDIKVEVVIDYGLTFSAQRQQMIGAILATASAGVASIFGEAEICEPNCPENADTLRQIEE
jgi:hypothetical protein